jgi:GTP-binding nuclear protein Ran
MNSKSTYKVIVIGDGGVGKTCFSSGNFEQSHIMTIGVNNHLKKINNTKFNIWDRAGQEKFGGLKNGYYLGADGVILMFDLTSHSSFLNLHNWLQDLRHMSPNIPILLCGNKSDISDRKVSDNEILNFITSNNLQYIETSAKNKTNVNVAFNCLKSMM